MSEPTPLINSAFEGEKGTYDKKTGDDKSEFRKSLVKFKQSMKTHSDTIKSGTLISGKSKLSIGKIAGVLGDIKGGMPSLADVKGKLADSIKVDSSKLKKLGVDKLTGALGALENIAGGLLDDLIGALLSRIFIPDIVYTASLLAFDITGADLEHDNNYIRKLIVSRGLSHTLKWWNNLWEIEYSGLRSDLYHSDGVISAQFGCYKNVEYVVGKYSDIYNECKSLSLDESQPSEVVSGMKSMCREVKGNMVQLIKLLVLNSYTDVDEEVFSGLLKKADVKPSVFGINDKEFGGRFAILGSEIDAIAPIYKPELDANGNPITATGIGAKILDGFTMKSSRFKRSKIGKKVGGLFDDIKDKFTYIDPRNLNIKRLYVYMYENVPKQDAIYNPKLADRLKYKIMTNLGKKLDAELGKFMPSTDILKFDKLKEMWESAYKYTLEIQDFLFDPAKIKYMFPLLDMVIITEPQMYEEVVNAVKPVEDGKKTADTIKDTTSEEVKAIINKDEAGEIKSNDPSKDTTAATLILFWINQHITNITVNTTNGLTDAEIQNIIKDIFKDIAIFIDTKFQEFISYDLITIIKNVIGDIKDGTFVVDPNDPSGNTAQVIVNNYIITNNIKTIDNVNFNYLLEVALNNIKNDINILVNKTFNQYITELMNTLKDDPILNDISSIVDDYLSNINKMKIMMENMEDLLVRFNKGLITLESLTDWATLKKDAEVKDSTGYVVIGKEIDTSIFITLNDLNKIIDEKGLISLKDIDIDKLIADAIVKSENTNYKLTLSELNKQMLLLIEDIIKEIAIGKKNLTELITYNDLMSKAISIITAKIDFSKVVDFLKDNGVDLGEFDIMEYHKDVVKKLLEESDPNFFDLDVTDEVAVKKTAESIEMNLNGGSYHQYYWKEKN